MDNTNEQHKRRQVISGLLKLALFFLMVTLCGATLHLFIRRAHAELISEGSPAVADLERAHKLDPDDQAHEKAIGDHWLKVAIPPRLELAETYYQAALESNPHDSLHWLDLGHVRLQQNRPAEARAAFAMATRLDPNNHAVRMEIGNCYLELDDIKEAYPHHAKAIRLNPSLARNIYANYWNLGESPLAVAQGLLADQPRLLNQYFLDALAWVDVASAQELWLQYAANTTIFEAPAYQRYFDFLIAKQAYPVAKDLWHQIAKKYYGKDWDESEFFWNSDLSRSFAFEGGLEWRLGKSLPFGVEADIQSFISLEKVNALHITFGGKENTSFAHIRHAFFVEPGQAYRLACKARTQAITTDNGPYLRVDVHSDPPHTYRSQVLTETGSWDLAVEFSVPASANWAELTIGRDRSSKLNNRIKGEAWFSAFSLERLDSSAPRKAAP